MPGLDDVRILDFADESAAFAGRILADLGAEVVMVEAPDGSRIRHLAPFLGAEPGVERSHYHQYFGANKRSVVIDPTASDAMATLEGLVASADVVIDTRSGLLTDLGVTAADLHAAHPHLIVASVTPFGLDAPWADRSANDLVAGASSGLMALCGERSGPPVQGAARPSFTMASLAASTGICLSLFGRDQDEHHRGTHLDISLQEATTMAAMQTGTPNTWTWFGRSPGRPGLSTALECADGGFVGHLVRPDRFDRFIDWLDREGIDHGMTTDDWAWSRLDAPRNDNPVAEATLALAAKLTRDEFAAGALEADIICLPVLGFADMERHEQYVMNDQFSTVHHERLGADLGFVRSPVDGMGYDVTIDRAPTLGEHTDEVLGALGNRDAPVVAPTATAAAGPLDPTKPLAGIRVVDFTWILAGPIGTRQLASFGAEVLRVESDTKPDSMRSQIGPDGTPHPDLGGLYNSVNAGKKSLSIDLSDPRGANVVKELIKTADVVVNNFRPGALERMGFGYDELRSLKSDIVLLNMPGPHQQGPWAVRSSMGNILMAASGFNLAMGFPGQRPRGVGVAYPDFTSPFLLTSMITTALRERDTSGNGQEIDLAQLSGVVALLGVEWMTFQDTREQPARPANRDPNWCPHGVFRAAGDDDWVAIAVDTDTGWTALCDVLGRPELATDPRFDSHDNRRANEDALDNIVTAWTRGHDRWEIADRCQAAGVAAAAVARLEDCIETDPQLREHYQVIHQPEAPDVDILIDREAIRFRGHDHRLERAPTMGEHNEEIVREIAGLDEATFVELLVDDVLR